MTAGIDPGSPTPTASDERNRLSFLGLYALVGFGASVAAHVMSLLGVNVVGGTALVAMFMAALPLWLAFSHDTDGLTGRGWNRRPLPAGNSILAREVPGWITAASLLLGIYAGAVVVILGGLGMAGDGDAVRQARSFSGVCVFLYGTPTLWLVVAPSFARRAEKDRDAITIRPWDEITADLRRAAAAGDAAATELLALVERMRDGGLAGTMHGAWRDGHLALTAAGAAGEIVRVAWEPRAGDFVVEATRPGQASPHWRKRCAPGDATSVLARFARGRGWIPDATDP